MLAVHGGQPLVIWTSLCMACDLYICLPSSCRFCPRLLWPIYLRDIAERYGQVPRDPEEIDRREILSRQYEATLGLLIPKLNAFTKRADLLAFVLHLTSLDIFPGKPFFPCWNQSEWRCLSRSQSDAKPTIFPALPLIMLLLRNSEEVQVRAI